MSDIPGMNAIERTTPISVMGRPSLATPELVTEICERLAAGEPLAIICREDRMPSAVTVGFWARANVELSSAIAHARDVGWDMIAWRLRATARGKKAEEGGESSGDAQRDRLIVDTDLKLLAKWDPKRYGERTALTGPDGGAVQVEHRQVVDVAKLGAGERDALRELIERAAAVDIVDVTPTTFSEEGE